ncbi:6338_t:CDS:1 [Funneliformis mosseae]|uniref:6338_t:CDS:1 n=1 Tax=Funneliformis mosseae TaxID=27381 RepID=A0A9N9DM60_FUNMO|nr:6338_t:CDS:1 [Funneliformis mosseae]
MDIFSALKRKANTLNYFINSFNGIEYFANILSKVLPDFHNLKVLKLNIITDDLEYHLKTSRFQHLEILQIDYIRVNAINCMIRNSGGRLKKILIAEFEIYDCDFYEESLLLIRTVRENCPLIGYLSLVFLTSDEHFLELDNLLRTCHYLKVLILETFDNFDDKDEGIYEGMKLASGEKILNVLIRSAPINLNVIGIFYDFNFPINILREFLENWKGRSALSFLISNDEYENEEFKALIDQYKDNGVIKEFGRCYAENIIDNFGI